MDLHGLVSGVIGAVNPLVPLSIQVSTGPSATAPDGKRSPTYADAVVVLGQVQALTFRDIQQIDGLNLQGTRRAIYISGNIDGLVRPTNKGGDLITLPDGTVYLVAMVLETWPEWCKVAVTLQNVASS